MGYHENGQAWSRCGFGHLQRDHFFIFSEGVGRIVFFYIKHIHRVNFSNPVFCEPTLIRLHPQCHPSGRTHAVRLQLQPGIGQSFPQQDMDGNTCWKAIFSDITMSLTFTSTSCVEVWPHERSTVLDPEAVTLPMKHSDGDSDLATYYATPVHPSPAITDLAASVRRDCDGTTPQFIKELLCRFATEFCWRHEPRRQYHTPLDWIKQAGGNLIDCAVAFAEVARAMNIPARLVRGYNAADADEIESRLRIWTELYLPGAGWRGYDPVAGQAIDESYIAVARSKTLPGTEPIVGKYRVAPRSCLVSRHRSLFGKQPNLLSHASAKIRPITP